MLKEIGEEEDKKELVGVSEEDTGDRVLWKFRTMVDYLK